jgi:hypothetical protein
MKKFTALLAAFTILASVASVAAISEVVSYTCNCQVWMQCGDEGYPYGPGTNSFHTGNCALMIGVTGNGSGLHGNPCGKGAWFQAECIHDGGSELDNEPNSEPHPSPPVTGEEDDELFDIEDEDTPLGEFPEEGDDELFDVEDEQIPLDEFPEEEDELFDVEDEQIPLLGDTGTVLWLYTGLAFSLMAVASSFVLHKR